MKRLFLSSLLALAFLSAPAFAEPICFKRDDFLKGTSETGTFAAVAGLSQNAQGAPILIEMFVNAEGDFLVVHTGLAGHSCVVATGRGFSILPKKISGNDT